MTKTCARCHATFFCKENDFLNCERLDVHLTTTVRSYIHLYYDDCLCFKCLCETKNNFYNLAINPKFKPTGIDM